MGVRVKGLVASVLVLGAVGGGAYYARKRLAVAAAPAKPVYAVSRVRRGTMVADVVGFGPLNPQFANGLQIPVSGTVVKVDVHQGSQVHRGEVLAILKNPSTLDTIQQDKVRLQRDEQALASTAGVPLSHVSKVQPNHGITVYAPQTGRVVHLKAAQGDTLTSGQVLATVVNDAKVVMQAGLVPYDYRVAAVGDPVTVRFSQFAGHVDGVITAISPNPTPSNGVLTYPATIQLQNPGLVTPGLKGTVTIRTPHGNYTLPHTTSVSGYGHSTVVNAPVAGTVESVGVQDNGWVTKGQPLLVIGGSGAVTAIEQAQATVAQDLTTLHIDEQHLKALTVRSRLNGIVGFLNLNAGESVRSGQFFGNVFNNSSMNLNINVDELQVANVHAGQPVEITSPGLPGRVFKGRVQNVASMGQNSQNGLATFSVGITVSHTSALKPGMTADARIVIRTVKNALLVPVWALVQQGTHTEVVVLHGGKPQGVRVKVGLVNSHWAQILSGLKSGEQVVTGMAGQALPGGKSSVGSSPAGQAPTGTVTAKSFARAGGVVKSTSAARGVVAGKATVPSSAQSRAPVTAVHTTSTVATHPAVISKGG